MSVRVFAPAKINLTLEVGPPRADGRHPLQSVVMFADVGDWIEAEADPDSAVMFYIKGPFSSELHEKPTNLVLDAIDVLQRAAPAEFGARVTLEKNLPIASGVGGGSADAAATLKALRDLWDIKLDDDALASMANELGADVPACVAARTTWMTGTGETFAPISRPPLNAVLVNPLKPLSTAAVYREFDRMALGGGFRERAPPQWTSIDEAKAAVAAIGNDLLAPAASLMPEIATIADIMRADPRALYVGLSGSGATLFALAANKAEADALAQALQARAPHWWVRPTTLG
jgi:4-diphosphocytidyl-2-C-methyl-D-erythritol kinase